MLAKTLNIFIRNVQAYACRKYVSCSWLIRYLRSFGHWYIVNESANRSARHHNYDAIYHSQIEVDLGLHSLTHWARLTHICVGNLTIIGSDNGLSPGRRQAIIWTYARVVLIGILGTNFNEILIEIHAFSFKKINLKISSGKWWPFCLGLNVLKRRTSYGHLL